MNQKLCLPQTNDQGWRDTTYKQLKEFKKGILEIECGERNMKCNDLNYVINICEKLNLQIVSITSLNYFLM